MVEQMGICEKHQLPLDRNGECELCRLSDMPSRRPSAGSGWWAVIIPVLLAIAGIAWGLSSWEAEPQSAPERGVPTTAPRRATPPPTPEQRPEPEPAIVPEPPTPPVPGGDMPTPEPSQEPTPEPSQEPTAEPSQENGRFE